jgi:hypothetical protein
VGLWIVVCGGSGALFAAGAGTVALAITFLLSGTFAGAVARTLAGTSAIAAAFALVHVALAIAFISACAARLPAATYVGGLGQCEAGGGQQAGDKDQDGFCFHVVFGFRLPGKESPLPALDETPAT